VPVVGPGIALLAQLAVALAVVLVAAIVPGWYESWRSLARQVDPGGKSAIALRRLHWPSWLPTRIAVALAVYAAGVVVVWAGGQLSWMPVLEGRAWVIDRIADLSTANIGNVLFGAIVVLVLFVAIEVVGASRWQGWDERERWEARSRPLPGIDRWRVWLQAVAFLIALVFAFVMIAIVEQP
jgi:hypothetical protein